MLNHITTLHNDEFKSGLLALAPSLRPTTNKYTRTMMARFNLTSYYFNSGLLIFNIKTLHAHYSHCLRKSAFRYGDQDILNGAFSNNTCLFPPKYNAMWKLNEPATKQYDRYPQRFNCLNPYSERDMTEAMTDSVVIHYYLSEKPWPNPAVYYQHKESYWHYFNKTLFRTQQRILIEEHLVI